MATDGKTRHGTEHKCMGIVEEAQERREKRRNKPQPWIVQKLAVFITMGIIVYAWYVYVGRFCVPMIKRNANALGSRSMGIAFLVVFCVIGLMMLWAYEKILFTSPGYAKHHVQKSPAPVIRNALPTWWDTESEADLAAARFEASHKPPQPPPPATHAGSRHSGGVSRHQRSGSSSDKGTRIDTNSKRKPSENNTALSSPREENVGMTDAFPPVATARAKVNADKEPVGHPDQQEQTEMQPEPLPGTANAKPMMYTRNPSKTPVLSPEYRYCHKDGFLKPYRAHHCRACGTCVLKYDHHCPWVGQCVGARNHRFFMIFVFWALIFCSFVFSTLIGLIGRAAAQGRPNFDVDGQKVAIMVLSGFFAIFTTALLVTHVILITSNMSTVEQMGARRMIEREKRVMNRLHAWWHIRARQRSREEWDAEWGRIGKEGHLWWMGSAKKNWEATMGDKAWMWFLPIGQSPDDGVNYVLNPRFDAQGRWRPRREWPAELQ